MSGGIAVKTEDAAGGPQIAGPAAPWTIGGSVIVLKGDPVTPHGVLPPHTSPFMAEGSSWFTINGVPVCREGHAANCGHLTTGRGWFTIP